MTGYQRHRGVASYRQVISYGINREVVLMTNLNLLNFTSRPLLAIVSF